MEPDTPPVFIVLLKFAASKSQAPQFMEGHKRWLQSGFDDGVFLLAGSLAASQGGAIMAGGITRQALEQRVSEDPFVAEGVVSAEIIEIEPSRAGERLNFLLS